MWKKNRPEEQSTPTPLKPQLGVLGTEVCPSGKTMIFVEGECVAAAKIIGVRYGGSETAPGYPMGCYKYSGFWDGIKDGITVWFNKDVVGNTNFYATPICK